MAAGDDAAALEASLIENVARLDPDEVTRWESFIRLVKEGRTPDEIALTFGLTELQVKRTLALRASLALRPSVALRVMLAHAIVGSSLWHVRVEPQRAHNDAIKESVETCASEAALDERRRAYLDLLGFDPEAPTITRGYGGDHGVTGLFKKLEGIPDAMLLEVLAMIMAETLEVGTPLIELLGRGPAVNLAERWKADDALLDLIKDREVLDRITAEVAGDQVAQANAAATGKVKRRVIRDCLHGENGRAKVEGWVPRWMAFPPAAYTERGGVGTVSRAAEVAPLVPQAEAEPVRDAA